LTSASPKIHVFTVDYRGFGLSTGAPTERGLATDGVALVNFVLGLGIPPSHIVILGQSLGTAVSSAVALHFADPVAAETLLPCEPGFEGLSTQEVANVQNSAELENPAQSPIDFAAVILVASFSSLPKLLLNYRIGGFLPLLSPLRPYPRFQQFFLGQLHDTWNTSSRVSALTSAIVKSPSRNLRLHILHARNDWDIPWRSGEENFQNAEQALLPKANEEGEVEKVEGTGVKISGDTEDNQRNEVWLGEKKRVELIFEILRFGGELSHFSPNEYG
jgi:abhydrolase domain-containing protein 12